MRKPKKSIHSLNSKLRLKYGITLNQYQEMIIDQNNCCAICRKEFGDERTTRPHVDHDHASKWVRGLLCGSCNLGIGMFGENIESLQAAIDYLIVNVTPTEFYFSPIPAPKRIWTEEHQQNLKKSIQSHFDICKATGGQLRLSLRSNIME